MVTNERPPIVSGNPRTQAERVLAQNRPLVFHVLARRFPSLLTGDDRQEEAEAVASLWLWKAAERYDPARGCFSTFAWRYIQGGLLHHVQALRRQGRLPVVSLDAAPDGDRDLYELLAEGDLAGEAPPRDAPGVALLAEVGLERLLAGLPPHQAGMLRLVYRRGLSQAEAAEFLGVSRSRGQQIHADALEAIVRAHAGGLLAEYEEAAVCRARKWQGVRAQWAKRDAQASRVR